MKSSRELMQLLQSDNYSQNSLAVAILHKRYMQGSVDAAYNLGVAYIKGIGVLKDIVAGADFLLSAAQRGHTKGMHGLAQLLSTGVWPSVYKSHPNHAKKYLASKWLVNSALSGNDQAQALLKQTGALSAMFLCLGFVGYR